jgi:hypothetical protein
LGLRPATDPDYERFADDPVAGDMLLRARGMTEAALGVDTQNLSGALRVYGGCGFVPISRTTTYRKPLT